MRVPSLSWEIHGARAKMKLSSMDTATSRRTIRSFRAGGMMMARNMPYRSTPSALTTFAGRMLPTTTPRQVPRAQKLSAHTASP